MPYEPKPELIERLKGELPELPGLRIARLEPGLGYETALGLVTSGLDSLYEQLVEEDVEEKAAANVLMNEFTVAGVDPEAVDPSELAKVIKERSNIQRAAFNEAIAASVTDSFAAIDFISQSSISDTSELEPLIDRILADNPGQVEQFRGGKEGVLGFFVGQVMKETGGKANAKVVSELVRAKLNG